jgi:hypothetical protein
MKGRLTLTLAFSVCWLATFPTNANVIRPTHSLLPDSRRISVTVFPGFLTSLRSMFDNRKNEGASFNTHDRLPTVDGKNFQICVPPAQPDAGSDIDVCQGSDIVLSATTADNVTFLWSGPNGFTSQEQNPVLTDATPNISGYYKVHAITNENCFSEPDSVLVHVRSTPPSYDYAAVICSGERYPFGSDSLLVAGNYHLIELAKNGCDSIINLFLAVIPPATPVTFELVSGSARSVSANGAQTCVGGGPLTFAASKMDGTWHGSNVDADGTFNPTSAGIFQMAYTYINDNGCPQTDHVGIEVIDIVPVDAGGNISTTYASDAMELIAVQPSGGYWVGPGVTDGYFDPKASGIGTFVLTYVLPDCGGSDGIDVTVDKGSQTIYFDPLPEKTYGMAAFDLDGYTTSGMGVFFQSSDPNVATIDGRTVTIVGVGSTSITASQPGDQLYYPANDNAQVLTINKADQEITFDSIPAKQMTDEPFELSATATSGQEVTYSLDNPLVATLNGNQVIMTGPGTATITAKQSGNSNYNAAVDVTQILNVSKVAQTINFPPITSTTLGHQPFTPDASTSSGLTVVLTSSSDKISITNNEVTLIQPGRVTIDANQSGSNVYTAAATVQQSFCVNPLKPTIAIANGDGLQTLTSSASSGNRWFKDGIEILGGTTTTLEVDSTGNYKVRITIDDCVSEFSEAVDIVILSNTLEMSSEVAFYPNPVHNRFEISGINGEIRKSEVFDLEGRATQLSVRKKGDVYIGYVGELAQGLYVIHIQVENKFYQLRFMKL